jgi:hypothetical protein|tara:strand:+ start:2280 stop:2393 length:114 start_codon:yes stop_codon:yes gene_type:complete
VGGYNNAVKLSIRAEKRKKKERKRRRKKKGKHQILEG